MKLHGYAQNDKTPLLSCAGAFCFRGLRFNALFAWGALRNRSAIEAQSKRNQGAITVQSTA